MGQEAQYRGLTPVHFEWGLEAAAKEIVGTDREQLAARAGLSQEVYPYILPVNTQGQSLDGKIALDISVLSDAQTAIATWLHEAAHVEHDTDDATAAHVDAVAQVAARVIATYAMRA